MMMVEARASASHHQTEHISVRDIPTWAVYGGRRCCKNNNRTTVDAADETHTRRSDWAL
jgi:hypothetical protein